MHLEGALALHYRAYRHRERERGSYSLGLSKYSMRIKFSDTLFTAYHCKTAAPLVLYQVDNKGMPSIINLFVHNVSIVSNSAG